MGRHGLSLVRETPGRAPRENLFDALRLFAALAVLISHAWALAIHGDAQPKVGAFDVGTIGVHVFFGISGFLIVQSWMTDPHLGRFFIKRALRILPALVVVVVLTTFALGPLFSTLTPNAYFGDPQTWAYLVNNALLMHYNELPGVFAANPTPEVNGSLWTLGPEAVAYLAVAVAGVAGGLRRWWIPPLIAAALIAVPRDPTGLLPLPREIWFWQTFAIGASLYVMRERVPWHPALAVLGLAGFAVTGGGLQQLFAVTAIPYAAILFAHRGPAAMRKLTARGDFSYGIYIFAWPMGQVVVALAGGSVSPLVVIALSLPVTFLLAVASWKLVEQPALALKKRAMRRSLEPRAALAAAEAPIALGTGLAAPGRPAFAEAHAGETPRDGG